MSPRDSILSYDKYVVSDAMAGVFSDAIASVAAGDYDGAITHLNTVIPESLTAYESSVRYQILGAVFYEKANYASAILNFEYAIMAEGYSPKESAKLRVMIAQLLIVSGKNVEGAEMLAAHIAAGHPAKRAYISMIMGVFILEGQYERALPWARKWFDAAEPKQRKHYDVLKFLYTTLDMPEAQTGLIKEMIEQFPEDRSLWWILTDLLDRAEDAEAAFVARKTAYQIGAFDVEDNTHISTAPLAEAQILKLAAAYAKYGAPYQAAQILERELNAGTVKTAPERLFQLHDYWYQARDYKKAISVMEQAAITSTSGDIHARLGEAFYKNGQCDKGEAALLK